MSALIRRGPTTGQGARALLRSVLLALGFAFAVGLGIGTWLRCEMEKPIGYLAQGSASAPFPLNVWAPSAVIRDASEDEEKIGEPVQIADREIVDRLLAGERHGAALGAATHRARQMKRRRSDSPAGQHKTL